MKNIVLITNNEKKNNVESANQIKGILTSKGCSVRWLVMPAPGDLTPMDIPEDTDLIITIGGDGTMVRTAQRTIGSRIPLIGYNRGHLGYLCDINDKDLELSLESLVNDKYYRENRMMLSGKMIPQEGEERGEYHHHALNDIVLFNSNGQSIIRLNIYVNGSFLYSFGGDGIIVATPTGSTAYNLSGGGPIVDPKTKLMLLTPINPHTLNSRSIILDAEDEVEITLKPRRSRGTESVVVTFDGAHRDRLEVGERLLISKAAESTDFIRLDKTSFVERMKSRLGE